jgi:hypothetical protein
MRSAARAIRCSLGEGGWPRQIGDAHSIPDAAGRLCVKVGLSAARGSVWWVEDGPSHRAGREIRRRRPDISSRIARRTFSATPTFASPPATTPSRRQPTPAFSLLVDALRYRGPRSSGQACPFVAQLSPRSCPLAAGQPNPAQTMGDNALPCFPASSRVGPLMQAVVSRAPDQAAADATGRYRW